MEDRHPYVQSLVQVLQPFKTEFSAQSLTRAVADTCVFLASDDAAAITGADINVNSGVLMY